MTRIVEETDSVWASDLCAPCIGVHRLMENAQARVVQRDDFEIKTLERMFEQCDVIVRISEPADLTVIGFIADQERDALLGQGSR